MPEGRPAIPAQLRRDLFVEAGHRCAIPTCRQTSALEIEHIEDWVKVRTHEFANMIVLCAVCHHRKTIGEIDRKALRQYKANLAVMNGRYGEVERRVLESYATGELPLDASFSLPEHFTILLMYLLRDGLLERRPQTGGYVVISGFVQSVPWGLTPEGRDLVQRWMTAGAVG